MTSKQLEKKEVWQFPKNKLIITNEVINIF